MDIANSNQHIVDSLVNTARNAEQPNSVDGDNSTECVSVLTATAQKCNKLNCSVFSTEQP